MTDSTTPAAPSAQPSAPATPVTAPAAAVGQPTHVSQAGKTDYQPAVPAAGAKPDAAAEAAAAAAAASAASTKPDAAAMKAFLGEHAKEVSLDGKSDADIAQLYADAQAKVAAAKPADAEFKLPDEYKDKPWAAKIKSQDDLYKQIDTLDALKGKKSIVPNLKDATPEEREAFYAQLRGKDAAEYPIPDNKAFPTPEGYQPVISKLFMDNGVSPIQAEAIIKGYQELGAKEIGKQFDPEGFKSSMLTAFGSDWEKTTGAVRNTIKSMMSPADQKTLDAIPNNLLGVVYRTLGNTIKAADETLKKYGATESFAHLQAPNGRVASTDLTSVRQGLRDQLAALSMRPHTAAEQSAIIDQLNKTYENDPRIQQSA